MATITVTDLLFRDDTGTLRLDAQDGWEQAAIGINSAVNLVAEVEGADFADMPETLPVDVSSQSLYRVGGPATLTRLRLDLRKTADLGGATRYELTTSWDELPFKDDDSMLEVATVMRSGFDATAADLFRHQLQYAGRGVARQPSFVKRADGSISIAPDPGSSALGREVPPAEFVMLGGGVEILVAQVPRARDRRVASAPARALVRSPADVWFYSGHGLRSGKLVVGPVDGTRAYLPWKGPSDFLAAWIGGGNKARTVGMRMLIINGCNVLNLEPAFGEPGTEWIRLMRDRGGNLTHILGYASNAPLDSAGGAVIAAKIGRALRERRDPVSAWLEINAAHRQWGAVAIDAAGYHAFDEEHRRVTLALP